MDRREAIATVSWIMGGALIGGQAILSGCQQVSATIPYEGLLTPNGHEALLEEVAETILPGTPSSPGAKVAKVGRFINVMVTECYEKKEQLIFMNGINTLKEKSINSYNKGFMDLDQQQKHELLLSLEEEIKHYSETRQPHHPEVHYYKMMKELSLIGFLTSEVAMTKVMRHEAIPGRYDPCVPHQEGEKAWV